MMSGLQIETPNDDGCEFLLLSQRKAAGEKPPENMACSDVPASQSLHYQATIKNRGRLMEIETNSLQECKTFVQNILNSQTSKAEKVSGKHKEIDLESQYLSQGNIKTPEDYEGPGEIQVASECKEKHGTPRQKSRQF